MTTVCTTDCNDLYYLMLSFMPLYSFLKLYRLMFLQELIVNINYYIHLWGMRLQSWLRHYATSQKNADSIPNAVFEFFD
jgi:hypothetical protein